MSRIPKDLPPDVPIPLATQEKFAHNVALRGMEPKAAYVDAYGKEPKQLQRYASELMKRQHMKARITYLADLAAKEEVHEYEADRKWISEKLLKLYKECDEAGDRPNTLRVLNLMGTDLGMFVQKKELLTGSINPLEEDPNVLRQRLAGLITQIFPGVDPDALIRAHGEGRNLVEAARSEAPRAGRSHGEVEEAEVVDIQPLPEADGISRARAYEAEALPHGGEPGRQDVQRGDGDQLSPDG
jgi:hypothetical protein